MDNKIPLKLRSDLIAIKIDPEEEKVGDIVLPVKAREKPMTGTVVAVGPGLETKSGKVVPTECQVGDKVWWISEWMGAPAKLGDEEFYVIHDDEILMREEAHG